MRGGNSDAPFALDLSFPAAVAQLCVRRFFCFFYVTSYENHLEQRGLTEYTLDGAINRERWIASPVKVIFYLKENYGYQEYGIINIQNYAHNWLVDKKTRHTSVLFHSPPPFNWPSREDNHGEAIALPLGEFCQVGAFGQILSEQTIGVIIAPALLGVAK